MGKTTKEKLLVFITAHRPDKSILNVIDEIQFAVTASNYQILILIDTPRDLSFTHAIDDLKTTKSLNIEVLYNPEPQGYGGNQKLAYFYAIKNQFDTVVLLHRNGKGLSEFLNESVSLLTQNTHDAVIGCRAIKTTNRNKSQIPLVKILGIKVLTMLQNKILNSNLNEFHSGCRAYTVKTLSDLPFEFNSNDFHFDTELIIQLLLKNCRIKELSLPIFHRNEISFFKGLRYAWKVLRETVKSRFHLMSVYYERKFDIERGIDKYKLKLGFPSSHEFALAEIKENSSVLDIGCGDSLLAAELLKKGCQIDAVDCEKPKGMDKLNRFIKLNLNSSDLPIPIERYDYILLMDVLEHLEEPEGFVHKLRNRAEGRLPKIIVSVPNIGFIVMRLQLLFGNFNYGIRGILDLGHRRLFTFKTITNLFKQSGYKIYQVKGVPAPFPLAVGNNIFSQLLLRGNQVLIYLFPRLFSYQIFLTVVPYPTINELLKSSISNTSEQKEMGD